MAQFDIYRNPAQGSKGQTPYLLDIQHDLLSHLHTRLVIPLVQVSDPATHLNPVVTVEGQHWMLSTQEMAGIPCSACGECVGSLSGQRDAILYAVDFLVTGF